MENEVKNSFRSGYTKGMGVGLVLMVIGVIFLAANFGFVSDKLRNILISWQMLLIVIGVVNLFRQRLIPAVWLIFIGGFFMIPKVVEGIDGNFIQITFDFLIVAFCIFLFVKGINSMSKNKDEAPAIPSKEEQLLTEIRDLLKK